MKWLRRSWDIGSGNCPWEELYFVQGNGPPTWDQLDPLSAVGEGEGGCASESIVEFYKNASVHLGDLPTWGLPFQMTRVGPWASFKNQSLPLPFIESLSMSSSNLWSHAKVHSDISHWKLRALSSGPRAMQLHPPDLGSSPRVCMEIKWDGFGQEQAFVYQEFITQQETSSCEDRFLWCNAPQVL